MHLRASPRRAQSILRRMKLLGAMRCAYCTLRVLMAELLDVVSREKFAKRLAAAGLTPLGIVGEIRRLAVMAAPLSVPRVVANDADDDHVLACALTAQADLIVSGDKHLLGLGDNYQGIAIVTPAQAVQLIGR